MSIIFKLFYCLHSSSICILDEDMITILISAVFRRRRLLEGSAYFNVGTQKSAAFLRPGVY